MSQPSEQIVEKIIKLVFTEGYSFLISPSRVIRQTHILITSSTVFELG